MSARMKCSLIFVIGFSLGMLLCGCLLANTTIFGLFFNRYLECKFGVALRANFDAMGINTTDKSSCELILILLETLSDSELNPNPSSMPLPEQSNYLSDLEKNLRASQMQLRDYAKSIRSGMVKKEPGMVTYPLLAQGGSLGIKSITMDENGNVYFALKGSYVNFNCGVVLRIKGRELLGDQREPRITYTRELFDDWWYYRSN